MPFDLSGLTRAAPAACGGRVDAVGHWGLPVLVLDDFLQHPLQLRALALSTRFVEPPDRRVPAFLSVAALDEQHVVEALFAAVGHRFYEDATAMEHHGTGWRFYRAGPRPGSPDRRPAERPRNSPLLLVAQVFLNLPMQCRGGTGFFRHVPTGAEALIPPELMEGRFPDGRSPRDWALDIPLRDRLWDGPMRAAYERERAAGHCGGYEHFATKVAGAPGDRYRSIVDSQGDWELHHSVEMKFNRLVVFPGYAFHADIFRPDWFGRSDVENRLVLQFEFNWPATPGRLQSESSPAAPRLAALAEPAR